MSQRHTRELAHIENAHSNAGHAGRQVWVFDKNAGTKEEREQVRLVLWARRAGLYTRRSHHCGILWACRCGAVTSPSCRAFQRNMFSNSLLGAGRPSPVAQVENLRRAYVENRNTCHHSGDELLRMQVQILCDSAIPGTSLQQRGF